MLYFDPIGSGSPPSSPPFDSDPGHAIIEPVALQSANEGALHVQHESELTDSTAAAAKMNDLLKIKIFLWLNFEIFRHVTILADSPNHIFKKFIR